MAGGLIMNDKDAEFYCVSPVTGYRRHFAEPRGGTIRRARTSIVAKPRGNLGDYAEKTSAASTLNLGVGKFCEFRDLPRHIEAAVPED